MTTYNEISAEELMKRIKEEVGRSNARIRPQNSQQINGSEPIRTVSQETNLWRFVMKMQHILKKYPFYGLIYRLAIRLAKDIPKHREYIAIEELVKFHDEEFIKNAYRAILQRDPDEEGYRLFLTDLRLGRSNKFVILGRLRYSPEGERRCVTIKGLRVIYIINSIYRIPAIGYIVKLSVAIIRLPKLLQGISEYEAFTSARFTRYSQQLNEVSANLELRTEKISNELSSKADAEVVDGIRNELSSKADAEVVVEIKDTLNGILRQIKNMIKEDDHMLDAMYLAFEDQFRGTREDIKERLKVYLPYLEKIKVVMGEAFILDVGCGRGEWLELLKENGYTAQGLDLNRVMVQHCKELGLEVGESDVIEYLRKQQPNSFSLITGFHVIEHLPLKILIALFDESLRVLKPGGMVIFETPNPENLIVGAFTFYYDPTHKNPLPPGTTQFLLEQRGFTRTEIIKLHKYSDFVEVKDGEEFKNKWFYSEMDYSIVAFKS